MLDDRVRVAADGFHSENHEEEGDEAEAGIHDGVDEDDEEEGTEIGLLRLAVRSTNASYHSDLPGATRASSVGSKSKHHRSKNVARPARVAVPSRSASLRNRSHEAPTTAVMTPAAGLKAAPRVFAGVSSTQLGALVILLRRLAVLLASYRGHLARQEWARLTGDLHDLGSSYLSPASRSDALRRMQLAFPPSLGS